MKLVTSSNMQVGPLSGIWRCSYYFPSNTHNGDDASSYYVRLERTQDGFVLHSLPNAQSAYIQAHCTLDANLATGVWLENTAPQGEFQSKMYSGVFQVIISDDQKHMEGRWVGIGSDHGRQKIYEGAWEITYAGEVLKDLPEL